MKKAIHTTLTLIVLAYFTSSWAWTQVIFSRFDFNSPTYTAASIGPDAIAMDPDVVSDGSAIYIGANCAGTKGIDMTIPNPASLFDVPSMGMTFGFRKHESRSDFFVRGGTRFYQAGDDLYVDYRTSDGSGGFIDYGPFNTGYNIPADNLFHEFTFIYTQASGLATVQVDGTLIWSNDGPDARPYYWTGALEPVVGTVMDGNCNGVGILDYAYFFNPDVPLGAEFQSFAVAAVGNDAQLDWEVTNEEASQTYFVERSKNGVDFVQVGDMNSEGGEGLHSYTFRDLAPGNGSFFYRVRQLGSDGDYASSEIQKVTLGVAPASMNAWPNPGNGLIHLNLEGIGDEAQITISDLKGSTLYSAQHPTAASSMDLTALPQGMYVLQCACGGAPLIQKLMIR